MKKQVIVSALVLSILCSFNAVQAQTGFQGFALNPQAGFFNKDGLVYGGDVDIAWDKMVYSAGYHVLEEHSIASSDRPLETYEHYSFMLGKNLDRGKIRIQYLGGIAPFLKTKRTNEIIELDDGGNTYATEDIWVVGLSIKAGVKYIPFRFMSVGVDFIANFNKETPLYIPTLSVEFGLLK
ncbi:hypothetical protein L21SP5_00071 [Salinivirga cyanobacteriivorans]|uniref:Outer membrane protein beta-barrel domain-containing protein n=1 Tax=Salinivirga cyanobacteriivorans TaxID=1307839 RepID=A0A0S2HUK8_9BACT|nr:hypothetical protein [Salinivirga cyanobacteriivorans]ALO13753.1 hypothetical protein L21SP5_00071 [Salinivirga cyanobacteriivorans]